MVSNDSWKTNRKDGNALHVAEQSVSTAKHVIPATKLVRAWGDVSINPTSTISTDFSLFTTKNMDTSLPKNCSERGELCTRSTGGDDPKIQ